MRIPFALFLLPALTADRLPERPQDSVPILDEQYRQMDRYFDEQIAKAEQKRAAY